MALLTHIENGDEGSAARGKINKAFDLMVDFAGSDGERPGDSPLMFTPTLTGAPEDVTALTGATVETSERGRILRVTAPFTAGSVRRFALNPGEIRFVRWAVTRNANAPDPLGDTVRLGIVFLSNEFEQISEVAVFDLNLMVADGRQERLATIGGAEGEGITHIWPVGAVYAVPFVRSYGSGSDTDLEIIQMDGEAATSIAAAAATAAIAASGVATDAADAAAEDAEEVEETRQQVVALVADAVELTTALPRVSRVVLKALDTTQVTVAYLTESGCQGMFDWDSADRSSFMEVQELHATGISGSQITTSEYGHQLDTGSGVYVKAGIGGLSAYVLYFVVRTGIQTFRLASSLANAKAGTTLTLTNAGAFSIFRHADPHEGVHIIPNGRKCNGSEGVWRRQVALQEEYKGEWFGLDASFAHNQAILTAALTALPNGATLVVPQGTWPISRYTQMRWRTGQTLVAHGWGAKLQGNGTASCVVRIQVSGCSVIGLCGGNFTGQVEGELTNVDQHVSESCGVQIWPIDGTTIENIRVRDNHFYQVDTGACCEPNYDDSDDGISPPKMIYYLTRHCWIESNLFTEIRRQGVELFCVEYSHVHHNTIFMDAKGVGFSTSRVVRVVGAKHATIVGNRFYGFDETSPATRGVTIEPASMSHYTDPGAIRFAGNVQIIGNYFENFAEDIAIIGGSGPVDVIGNQACGNPIMVAPSSTVTISVATPAIVAWTGHMLPNGTRVRLTTTGALPTGLSTGTDYYVVNATTNNFQLEASVGGGAIATTGAGSGAHTATAPDLRPASRAQTYFCRQGNLGYAEATSIPNVQTVTMTIASPCVVTWTGHLLVNGDAVSFVTTGALPTGISVGTTYYVVNKAVNTFQLSLTPGGAAIDTSGTQSGTHTILADRWVRMAKMTTNLLTVSDNTVLSKAIFFESQGAVVQQHICNNRFIGNGNSNSKLITITNSNDVAGLERCEMTNIEGNYAVTNELSPGGPITITNTRSGEIYTINRNRMSPGPSGVLFSEAGAVTTGTVTAESIDSNEALPTGRWAALFNPPRDFGKFNVGSL